MTVCPGQEDQTAWGCKRTCSFDSGFSKWQGAKPGTPMQIFFHGHGEGLSREPYCDYLFGLIWTFWISFPRLSRFCTVSVPAIQIYFRSLFQIQLHVTGFSSQRITSMIHFLSSVCVC